MFRIEFSSKAKKEFDQLKDERIEEVLKVLVFDPVPAKRYDVKKLKGIKDTFRIRVGKFRVVYTIIWKDGTILVSRISFRESAYD